MLAPKQHESLFSLVLAKQLPCTLNFISGQFLRQCRAPRFSRSSTSCSLFDKCRLRVDRRPWETRQLLALKATMAGYTTRARMGQMRLLPKPRGFWDYSLFVLAMTGLMLGLFWVEASDYIGWAAWYW